DHAFAAAMAARNRVVGGGVNVGAGGNGAAGTSTAGEDTSATALAWRRWWHQLQRSVSTQGEGVGVSEASGATMAASRQESVAGATYAKLPMPPTSAASSGGQLFQSAFPAPAVIVDPTKVGGAAQAVLADSPTRTCRGTASPETHVGIQSGNNGGRDKGASTCPTLDPRKHGPMGHFLVEGGGILTIATAALLGVLEDPGALSTCPQLVRQVLLLEPYVSHALYDSSGGGDGGAAAAGAASRGASQPTAAGWKAGSGKPRAQPKSKAAAARALTDAAGGLDPASANVAAVGAVAAAAPAVDDLGTIDVREHISRAKDLLRRLLAETVMLGMGIILGAGSGEPFAWTDNAAEAADADATGGGGGGGGGGGSSWAAASTSALTDMATAPGAEGDVENQGAGQTATGPASEQTVRRDGAALALVYRRAMSMYRWLRGHLLERENRVLEAQESYLQCLGALPAAGSQAIALTGNGGAHSGHDTAQTGLCTTTRTGYDMLEDRWSLGAAAASNQRRRFGTNLDSACGGGGIWPGCWSLPGCSILQPPTAAAVQVRVRALEVFRTMASAEQLVASGEYEQAVMTLRDVAFPQRPLLLAVGSGVASAAASAAPDVEDLPSSAAAQAADAEASGDGSPFAAITAARNQARVQVRAVQLLKEALMGLLQPRPPQTQSPPPPPPPAQTPQQTQQAQEQRQSLRPDGPLAQRDMGPLPAAASVPDATPPGSAVVAAPAAVAAAADAPPRPAAAVEAAAVKTGTGGAYLPVLTAGKACEGAADDAAAMDIDQIPHVQGGNDAPISRAEVVVVPDALMGEAPVAAVAASNAAVAEAVAAAAAEARAAAAEQERVMRAAQ
ncbi:hypothetical protein Vretimale_16758, partial [Volvox reticuliferus]